MRMLLLLALATTATAECACGYSTGSANGYALFTDLLETDFLHVKDITYNDTHDIGWIPQDYNTSATDGPYGMAKESNNLVPNYIDNKWDYGGPGIVGIDPGLQLWVRSTLIEYEGDKLVPSAEIVTQREDILYVNKIGRGFLQVMNDKQPLVLCFVALRVAPRLVGTC